MTPRLHRILVRRPGHQRLYSLAHRTWTCLEHHHTDCPRHRNAHQLDQLQLWPELTQVIGCGRHMRCCGAPRPQQLSDHHGPATLLTTEQRSPAALVGLGRHRRRAHPRHKSPNLPRPLHHPRPEGGTAHVRPHPPTAHRRRSPMAAMIVTILTTNAQATNIITFYVDCSAAGDGSGTQGSPGTT